MGLNFLKEMGSLFLNTCGSFNFNGRKIYFFPTECQRATDEKERNRQRGNKTHSKERHERQQAAPRPECDAPPATSATAPAISAATAAMGATGTPHAATAGTRRAAPRGSELCGRSETIPSAGDKAKHKATSGKVLDNLPDVALCCAKLAQEPLDKSKFYISAFVFSGRTTLKLTACE